MKKRCQPLKHTIIFFLIENKFILIHNKPHIKRGMKFKPSMQCNKNLKLKSHIFNFLSNELVLFLQNTMSHREEPF